MTVVSTCRRSWSALDSPNSQGQKSAQGRSGKLAVAACRHASRGCGRAVPVDRPSAELFCLGTDHVYGSSIRRDNNLQQWSLPHPVATVESDDMCYGRVCRYSKVTRRFNFSKPKVGLHHPYLT